MPQADTQSAPTGRRRGADRKREILAAARAVFSEKGYEKTSVAEIAAKVGIVEGAVYKHFATKRALLFEATATFYRPVVEETEQQLAAIDGTRERLRFVIWRHLRAFAEAPGFCRLIIQDVRPYDDYRDSVVRELNRASGALLLGIVDDAIRRGEARAGVSRSVFRDVIFGGIEHVMWKALEGLAAPDVERLADELTDLVLFGVSADGSAARAKDRRSEDRRSEDRRSVERRAADRAAEERGSDDRGSDDRSTDDRAVARESAAAHVAGRRISDREVDREQPTARPTAARPERSGHASEDGEASLLTRVEHLERRLDAMASSTLRADDDNPKRPRAASRTKE